VTFLQAGRAQNSRSGFNAQKAVAVEIPYVTREMVQDAVPSTGTPRFDARIDQAILAASCDLEGFLHRKFYPWTGTRYFDQPDDTSLWLYENELAETPTAIVSGLITMTTDDYILQPQSGPPYRWIDVNYGGTNSWSADCTPQNAVAITGTFHYPAKVTAVTTLSSGVNSSVTTMPPASSVDVGTGSLILVDSERMLVSRLASASTGTTLAGDLTANKGITSVPVASGAAISVGERILIDSEAMTVQDIAGNTLIVERAVRGSVLATHTTGATVYAPRTATVTRGVLGTTAAAHDSADVVSTLTAPSLVRELALALAINNVQQSLGAYTRPRGSGDNRSDMPGRGVSEIMEDAYTAYGRKARSRAV
jgi:hypothetical protein